MNVDWQKKFDELSDNLKMVKKKERIIKELIENPNEASGGR